MNAWLTRFRALPRAARWAILAGIAFGAYFLVIEPLLDRTNRFDARADAIEDNLRRAGRLADQDSDEGRLVINGMQAFGRPQPPNAASARPEAVQRVVDQVLESHGVANRTKTERSSTITGDRARALAADGRLERSIIEVSFEAPQEVVAAIIADLERSPGISSISRVKIDRTAVRGLFGEDLGGSGPGGAATGSSAGRVRATISAEAWVLIKPRAGESGGVSS